MGYISYERAIAGAYQFRPASPSASLCPRSLPKKGRKCTNDNECLCNRYRFGIGVPDFLDHAHRWIDKNGLMVLTSEPYFAAIENNPEEYKVFTRYLDTIGVEIVLGNVSPWTNCHRKESHPIASYPSSNPRSDTQLIIMSSVIPRFADNFRVPATFSYA